MPREFECAPYAAQADLLQGMGFTFVADPHAPSTVTWTGHGIEIELHHQTQLSLYSVAGLLIQTARMKAQSNMRASLGLK